MATKLATPCSSRGIGSSSNNKNMTIGSSAMLRPLTTHQSAPSPSLVKRGHIRSASLENTNAIRSPKNTLTLPATAALMPPPPNHTGTLKSRNEQKRMRNKFGSHNNLDDCLQPGRTKFQNIRQIFEMTKKRACGGSSSAANKNSSASSSGRSASSASNVSADVVDGFNSSEQLLQSLPTSTTLMPTPAANATPATLMSTSWHQHQQSPTAQQQQHCSYQQQYLAAQQQPHPPLARKPTPTSVAQVGSGSGNRNSLAEMNERLSIVEFANAANASQSKRQQIQQHHHQQQQQQQQQRPAQRLYSQSLGHHGQTHVPHLQQQMQQRQRQPQHQIQQQQLLQQQTQAQPQSQPQPQRSSSDLPHALTESTGAVGRIGSETNEQPAIVAGTPTKTTPSTPTSMSVMTSSGNLLRPIAFKPIPFEPDYSISNSNTNNTNAHNTNNNRYCEVATVVGDRYGSTPSLTLAQGANLRFGSTTDLRHGSSGVAGIGLSVAGVGAGVNVASGGIVGGNYPSSSYCNSLMARRRSSRSLKINDSMESIRHTPDSDVISQSSTIKSNCSNGHSGIAVGVSNGMLVNGTTSSGGSGSLNGVHAINGGSGGGGSNSSNGGGKYLLNVQCDMTPSPSDSGISDLEAALKDRDSELSYLRQTMEHNEKDKENFWELETKRLKTFYEGQQREYLLKLKKLEQMLAMQQFQFKQQLRHTDQTNKLREQLAELKNENEILRSSNSSLKNSERNLKDSVAYIEEQLRESENVISTIKSQLEESEWKVCERNGEIALLKTQLKEANVEITLKEHAIVHLRHENTNAETQIYESLQENQKISQHHKQYEEQQARSDKQSESELNQLNKIIILKDQVILALTNELAKLRKELSDLAIFQEYGEEPSGRYIRLKQQLDSLTDICNKSRKHAQNHKSELPGNAGLDAKVIDDTNLELIMNCLKIAPPLDETDSDNERKLVRTLQADKRRAKISADIQSFAYGSSNLPDITMNHKHQQPLKYGQSSSHPLEESTLDTLIEESANYAEEIGKLRKQLDDVRVNFELEKRQWCAEKEKVLNYQKQLQAHYINMYQKLRSLEGAQEV